MYYTNPILPSHAADPWIVQHGSEYFYCEAGSENRSIHIRRAHDIFSLGQAEPRCIWRSPEQGAHSNAVWAPELHWLNGRWYIYFAADSGHNRTHRMWVLESRTADPLGEYRLRGRLETSGWAIDGTVLQEGTNLYFIWSGWPGRRDGLQNLYIAPMKNPWSIAGSRILLATPDQSWEQRGMAICEGPQVLHRDGATFLIYSASASWSEDYCLGMLLYTGGGYLNPASWEKRGPVFQKSSDIWGLGHCSFVRSPCGAQDWIVYHSKSRKEHGWEDRDVHAQRFHWNEQGWPEFGVPVGRGVPQPTWRHPAHRPSTAAAEVTASLKVQFPQLIRPGLASA